MNLDAVRAVSLAWAATRTVAEDAVGEFLDETVIKLPPPTDTVSAPDVPPTRSVSFMFVR